MFQIDLMWGFNTRVWFWDKLWCGETLLKVTFPELFIPKEIRMQ